MAQRGRGLDHALADQAFTVDQQPVHIEHDGLDRTGKHHGQPRNSSARYPWK